MDTVPDQKLGQFSQELNIRISGCSITFLDVAVVLAFYLIDFRAGLKSVAGVGITFSDSFCRTGRSELMMDYLQPAATFALALALVQEVCLSPCQRVSLTRKQILFGSHQDGDQSAAALGFADPPSASGWCDAEVYIVGVVILMQIANRLVLSTGVMPSLCSRTAISLRHLHHWLRFGPGASFKRSCQSKIFHYDDTQYLTMTLQRWLW